MASEEMSFENLDGRRRTTDGQRMPTYTVRSHMSLRLRLAKMGTKRATLNRLINITISGTKRPNIEIKQQQQKKKQKNIGYESSSPQQAE